MPTSDLLSRYGSFATNLGVDLVVIFVMTYVLYFRRHWRSDLLLSYVALNMGIFVVMSVLGSVRIDIAVGFGLFAILSIVRLRSSAVTQQEVAYYFVALVLGLVNGINVPDRTLLVAMNVLLLGIMLVFDSTPLRERSRRLEVNLKHVYTDEASLTAELERRLGVGGVGVAGDGGARPRPRPPDRRRPAPARPSRLHPAVRRGGADERPSGRCRRRCGRRGRTRVEHGSAVTADGSMIISGSSPGSQPARSAISLARSVAGPGSPSSPGITRRSTRSPTTSARSSRPRPGAGRTTAST
jgi:hypothetical protein